MTDKTSTAPVMSLRDTYERLRSLYGGSQACLDTHMTDHVLGPMIDSITPYLGCPSDPSSSWIEGTIVNTRANSYPGMHVEVAADIGFTVNSKVWLSMTPPVAPTPDVVGGDVVARVDEYVAEDGKTKYAVMFEVPVSDLVGSKLYAAPRVQGDAVPAEVTDKQIRCIAACIADDRYVSHATAKNEAFLKTLRNALFEASSTAQPKGDDLVRYCPECSLMGDVPVGARDCCPDGSAARMIPRHIAHAAHRDFHHSIQSHPAEQTRGDGITCDRCGSYSEAEASTRCIPDGDDCPGCNEPLVSKWDDAAELISNICELSAADPDHPQTVCVNVESLATEIQRAFAPRQAAPDGLRKDAFHDGVLLALQVLNGAGNGGDAHYMELLGCVDHRDLLARARQEDMLDLTGIEKWIDYGIKVGRLAAAPSAGRMGVE